MKTQVDFCNFIIFKSLIFLIFYFEFCNTVLILKAEAFRKRAKGAYNLMLKFKFESLVLRVVPLRIMNQYPISSNLN